MNLSDRFPYQGRDEGMPSGGLSRKGQDTDGDEGALLSPACPGPIWWWIRWFANGLRWQ